MTNSEPVTTQLSLFEEKIPIDKNFSFHIHPGFNPDSKSTYKFDFEESFEEPNAVINDILVFIMKQYYDDPVYPVFTLKDYADFIGKSIENLRKKTIGDHKNGNELERLLFKLVNRNLVVKAEFTTKNNDTGTAVEPFPILGGYTVIKKGNIPKNHDKRIKLYTALPHSNIRKNIPSYLYYVIAKDYHLISSKYYRNPAYKILYMRLCSLYNSLKSGREEFVTFDELAKILDYTIVEPRKTRQLIIKSVNKILEVPSLSGLGFKMGTNPNGKYDFTPHFWLKEEPSVKLLGEKTIDKFKRLDLLIIDHLRAYIPVDYAGRSFNYEEFYSLMTQEPNSRATALIWTNCYESNFGKSPAPILYGNFLKSLVYEDDFGNFYGSVLLKYCIKGGIKLANTKEYKAVKMLF